MACFLPTVNANHADNEFGPGIYTTPSLELALGYARVQGALMVFQNPDFRTLNVWEPSQDDWRIITTYWLRRTLSNAQERVPPGMAHGDGAVPSARPGVVPPGATVPVSVSLNSVWMRSRLPERRRLPDST